MSTRAAQSLALVAAGLTGCASILPKAPPETFHEVAYVPQPVDCPASYGSPVEVWAFSATAPYDRAEMVVTDGREVSFSRAHQWVDRPGVLVGEKLLRDLGRGGLFPLAVSPRDPLGAPLELTGNIFRFAWERHGSTARASLEADVVLRRPGEHPQVLLHRRYDLASDAVTGGDDPAGFARAMSGLVEQLSIDIRRDLCAAASGAHRAETGAGPEGRDGAREHDVAGTR